MSSTPPVVAPGTVRYESVYGDLPSGGTYTLALDAYIFLDKDNPDASHRPTDQFVAGIDLEGAGAWTINVNGGVWVSDSTGHAGYSQGIWLDTYASTKNSKIVVGTDGVLSGYSTGILSSAGADITNAGTIISAGGDTQSGINFIGFNIENGDVHTNLTTGKAISVTNNATGFIGTTDVGIQNWSYATLTVKNAGEISGGSDVNWDSDFTGAAVVSGWGALVLTNSATINGDIEAGWIGSSVTNAATGVINGTVVAFIPGDTDGAGHHALGGANNAFLDLDHDGDFSDVSSKGAISLTDPKAIFVTVTNNGVVNGVSNYGHNDQGDDIQTAMDLSQGNDVVVNNNILNGDVWTNGGDDKVTNNKTGLIQGFVDLGDGNNTLTNNGTILYGIGGNDGVDNITNAGTIGGPNNWADVSLHGGADIFINNAGGVVWGNVDLGDGANNYNASKGGIVKGQIITGSNVDTVTGGAGAEVVIDKGGADTYHLGAGNDTLYVSNDGATDSMDGGAGIDTLDFSGINHAINVNLTGMTAKVAGTATIDGTIDNILAFEIIKGSDQGDTITGSSGADTIYGNDGADTIRGFAGADTLWGGPGNDTFVYALASESGVTKATRDIIADFSKGGDHIDLTGFTTLGANDPIANGAFTGTAAHHSAGEMRYYWLGNQTILEADTNGDGKADFSVALNGHIALTHDDFVVPSP